MLTWRSVGSWCSGIVGIKFSWHLRLRHPLPCQALPDVGSHTAKQFIAIHYISCTNINTWDEGHENEKLTSLLWWRKTLFLRLSIPPLSLFSCICKWKRIPFKTCSTKSKRLVLQGLVKVTFGAGITCATNFQEYIVIYRLSHSTFSRWKVP